MSQKFTVRLGGRASTEAVERSLMDVGPVESVRTHPEIGYAFVDASDDVAANLEGVQGVEEVRDPLFFRPTTANPGMLKKFKRFAHTVPSSFDELIEDFDNFLGGTPVSGGEITGVGTALKSAGSRHLYRRGYRGEGAIAVVIDSGVDPGHVDEERRLSGWAYDDDDDPWTDPTDHGSMVAHIIAGNSFEGNVADDPLPKGAAPKADVYPISCRGSEEAVTAASAHALQVVKDNPDRPVVVCLSRGAQTYCGDYCKYPTAVAEYASRIAENGGIYVTAAGNDGLLCGAEQGSEGCGEWSMCLGKGRGQITVGASGKDGYASRVHEYSSRGDGVQCRGQPDVVAPAYGIYADGSGTSARLVNSPGTSAAAPVVAGAVCQIAAQMTKMRGEVPGHAEVREALRRTANNPNGGYDGCFGQGNVDAERAFQDLTRAGRAIPGTDAEVPTWALVAGASGLGAVALDRLFGR